MICPSMPIPSSTEFTEYLYFSCRKNITAFAFGAPLARGHMPPCLLPLVGFVLNHIIESYKLTARLTPSINTHTAQNENVNELTPVNEAAMIPGKKGIRHSNN